MAKNLFRFISNQTSEYNLESNINDKLEYHLIPKGYLEIGVKKEIILDNYKKVRVNISNPNFFEF